MEIWLYLYGSQNDRCIVVITIDWSLQEPEAEPKIKEFVSKFGVEFDMFSKVEVNGDNAHPLFKYLKTKLTGTLVK